MVTCTINGKKIKVPEGTTILDAAAANGIKIPTLCYQKDLNEIGACRICSVEVVGRDRLVPACNNVVQDGMVVRTNSAKARMARRLNAELLLSQHDCRCAICPRSGNCELQSVANDLNITRTIYPIEIPTTNWPQDFPLIRDNGKCIKCMRCIQECEKVQSLNVWDVVNTGGRTRVDVACAPTIWDAPCSLCGQCITHCPVNALHERDDTTSVFEALEDPDKITVLQIAPSVRTSWGEPFGLSPEFATAKRLVSACRIMGFDYIFDTDFSADLTIMEEAAEFLEKLRHRGREKFPMFTSCCTGWVRFLRLQYPDLVPQLSSAKSPQAMFGAIAKSYYAELLGVPAEKIFCVSIMPCLAKKFECGVPQINGAGAGRDVDAVLTVREIARMIRAEHLIVEDLQEDDFDKPMGTASGAGEIFGVTGGVMEAALRTAYYMATGRNPDPDAFRDVRGNSGWREAEFDIEGTLVQVAVVNGLGNARNLIEALQAGKASYDFVEVMACPGGCVGGGGEPIHEQKELAAERGQELYALDAKNPIRYSHENPAILDCYSKYLGKPLSDRAHALLHTDQRTWDLRPHGEAPEL